MNRNIALLFFLAITGLTAVFASQFEPGVWYQGLAKPTWTPPGWIFGPVWGVLYIFIAVAGWKVWKHQGLGLALLAWFAQLGLNGAWSYFMFGQKDITLALYDIAALLCVIAVFIYFSWRISRLAAGLFIPYFLWVAFAAALNFSIWHMNIAAA